MSTPGRALTALCGCRLQILQLPQMHNLLNQLVVAPDATWRPFAVEQRRDSRILRITTPRCDVGGHGGEYSFQYQEGVTGSHGRQAKGVITNAWEHVFLGASWLAGRLEDITMTALVCDEIPRPMYVGVRSRDGTIRYRIATTGDEGMSRLRRHIALWYGMGVVNSAEQEVIMLCFSWLLPQPLIARFTT